MQVQDPFPAMIEADSKGYVRERDLPKVMAVWPKELRDHSAVGTEVIIARIQKVLRGIYYAALREAWHYDTSRHVALLTAVKAEQAQLARLLAERRAICEEVA